MYNSFKDVSDLANFARKKGAKDKQKRKTRGLVGLLGIQKNKDGTKTLNKREEMTRSALGSGVIGAGYGTLAGLGVAGARYQEAIAKAENKRVFGLRGKDLERYENAFQKGIVKKLPKAALIGAAAGGLLGVGIGYGNYKNKRNLFRDYSLSKDDNNKVTEERRLRLLKQKGNK